MRKRICFISFSNNADNQNMIYSLFNALKDKIDVFTIGIDNPKTNNAVHTEKNYYSNCPLRPGITKGTFNLRELLKIKRFISDNDIKYMYFESQHIWNAFLMILCPKLKKIVAVHDVIPHDGNKGMAISNFVTCHLSDQIILRNKKYKLTLAKKYRLSEKKIISLDMVREWIPQTPPQFSQVFLYFGRIRKYKGLDKLIEIIKMNPQIQFRVVGEPDEANKIFVNQIKELSNASVLDMEVTDDQMGEEFTNADWVILPYSNATQSGVIVDAYRHSRPVITFDVGAISEQVINQKTGFLIPENDIHAFSQRIQEVSSYDYDTLKRFCTSAYFFGKNKYSAEKEAERLVTIITSE